MDKTQRKPPEELSGGQMGLISLAERIRAMDGPPPFILRRRRIEDLIERLTSRLREEHAALARVHGAASPGFREALGRALAALDLRPLHELIDKHNLYYPCEANLPIDVRSGQMLDGGRPWRPMARPSRDELLARALEPSQAART